MADITKNVVNDRVGTFDPGEAARLNTEHNPNLDSNSEVKANVPLVESTRDQSIQERGKHTEEYLSAAISNIFQSADTLPRYWSTARDIALDDLWHASDLLSGAMYAMVSKMTTIPFHVEAWDMSITSHLLDAERFERKLLEASEWGAGWGQFFSKQVESLLGQDNGRFMEIIDLSPDKSSAIRGPALAVAHLDPSRCLRTSNPTFPVLYRRTDGKLTKLHWTRVAFEAHLPSPKIDLYGIGLCLHRDAGVLMANGKYRKVIDLVNEKSTEKVMSVENGKLVAKRIAGWHKNSLGNRRLINVRGEYSKLCQGNKERNSWVTNDHKILTTHGWEKAEDLKTGDQIVTGLPAPNELQMQFIIGGLLGDLSMPKPYVRPRISMGHCEKQKEWFELKETILDEYGFKKRFSTSRLMLKGVEKSYEKIGGQTKSHASFLPIREQFYPQEKKVIPFDLIEEYFSPLLLATWYLDDGNILNREENSRNRRPEARFTTCGFTIEEVSQLCKLLQKHGYDARLISNRGEKNKKNIRLTTESSQKFFSDIASYAPPTMRYKLPRSARPFNPSLWNLGTADTLIDEIEITEQSPLQASTVYCIDVEDTHNFISAGIVVHNCAVSRGASYAQHMLDIAKYKEEKLGSRPMRGILLVGGGLNAEMVGQAMNIAAGVTDARGLTRFAWLPLVGATDIETPTLELIQLSQLPDGFKEQEATDIAMAAIALAFGVDARELWPGMQAASTRADALLSHIKQRGKGPGHILQETERLFNNWFLPRYLKLVFDFQDDAQDRQKAEIRHQRASTRKIDIENAVTDSRIERERMVKEGELSTAQFKTIELTNGRLPDGTPIEVLFFRDEPVYTELLTLSNISDPLNFRANKPEPTLDQIFINLSLAYEQLSSESRQIQKQQILQSIAALQFIQIGYEQLALAEELEEQQAIENAQGLRQGRTSSTTKPTVSPESEAPINKRPDDEQNMGTLENSPRELAENR